MAKEKVYLETSVISYLTARPSRDPAIQTKQQLTKEWWREHRTVYDTYLATWNCTHIHNAALRRKILDEIRRAGYNKVDMATPEELWRLTK